MISIYTEYDLYLRALPLWGSYEKRGIIQAFDLLGQAIERDPRYGPALALAANCHHLVALNDWTDDLEANRREGIDLAQRALRCAPDDPEVITTAAFTLGLF